MSEERTPEETETGHLPFLDTNCIVRYLTDDPPEMAEKAALVIDGDEPLIVSELVVAETAYVLESVYEYEREELVDALVSFIQRQNVRILQLPKTMVLEALRLCRSSKRHSFTDALLWAQARHHQAARLVTFDRRFPKADLEVTEPGSEEPTSTKSNGKPDASSETP